MALDQSWQRMAWIACSADRGLEDPAVAGPATDDVGARTTKGRSWPLGLPPRARLLQERWLLALAQNDERHREEGRAQAKRSQTL